MRNALAWLAAAALLAAAFFLPGALSQWSDQRLLDEPHITRQEEEREGFAESLQLSVAEKLLLLYSRNVTSVLLEDIDVTEVYQKKGVNFIMQAEDALSRLDLTSEEEESNRKWEHRLERVQSELRGLQTAGALPRLWDSSAEVVCTNHSQTLYIDQESQISFLTYNIGLSSPPYTIRLLVDAKSERILGFRLNWTKSALPDWGFRGTENFGTAWRDYWGMDSVSNGWNNDYIRSTLEMPEDEILRSGSYNSNANIAFSYDGQILWVPLTNWVYSNMEGALEWNLV